MAKNSWKESLSICGDLGIPSVDSHCLWFDVFDTKYAKFIRSDPSKNIPATKSICKEQDKVFDLSVYKQLSPGSKSMRNTCYPQYVEF